MKKSTLIKSSVLLMLPLLTLVSCGGNNGNSSGKTDDSSQQGGSEGITTTISFKHRNSQTMSEVIDSIISEFNKIPGNENITVKNDKYAGDYNALRDQVLNEMNTDEYPDLVECYPDHVVRYMDYGKVVDFGQYMNDPTEGWSADDKEDIIEAFLQEGQDYPIEGTYSLPLSKSSEAMYYNWTVLQNLQLDYNGKKVTITEDYLKDMTWEEMFEYTAPALIAYNEKLPDGEKIIDTKQAYYGVLGYDSDDNFFITLAEQYGYGYTSVDQKTGKGVLEFDNDNMKALMKKLNDYSNKHYLATKGTCNGDYINSYFTKNAFLFSIGSTAGSKYQQQNFADDVRCVRIPYAKERDYLCINQGPSVAMLSHNNDKDRQIAAWRFYKFLTNYANNLLWSTTSGYMPIRKSVVTSADYIQYCNADGLDVASIEAIAARTATVCAEVSQYVYGSPTFKGSSTCRSQVGSLTTTILMKPIAEATDEWINSQFSTCVNNIKVDM